MTEKEEELKDSLCDEKMKGLTLLIEGLSKDIKGLSNHIAESNGTVKDLVKESIKRQEVIHDFRHLETEFDKFTEKDGPFDCLKRKVDKIDTELLEVWFFKKYPKVGLGIITAAVLGTLAISAFSNKKTNDGYDKIELIERKVNYIENYIKIPNAPTRGAINAYPDTIK